MAHHPASQSAMPCSEATTARITSQWGLLCRSKRSPSCSAPMKLRRRSYAFKPLSDVATANERDNVPGLAGLYNVTVNTACHWTPGDCWWSGLGTWSGYWTGSASQSGAGFVTGGACPSGQVSSSSNPVQASSGCPLVFNQFPPGVYTVVAADEWGQVAVLHFTVAS